MKLISHNPATLEAIGEIETTPVEKISEIAKRAKEAFEGWKKLSIKERKIYLRKARSYVYDNFEEISNLVMREVGKAITEAVNSEIVMTLDLFDYYLRNTEHILRESSPTIRALILRHKKNHVIYEPKGVIGIISPWNYPFNIPMGQIIPALISGNCVIFKPSELTPLCGLKIEEIFKSAGLPEGVFNLIIGLGDVGASLVESDIDKICFTGSTKVGKKIMETASKKLTPVTLELGGKDPVIVCDDADIERASSGVVWGAFYNAGQTCVSIERCYINKKIADEFINKVVEKTLKLKQGYGIEADVEIGPMISENQFKIVEKQVEEAKKNGARVLTGGKRNENFPGYFYEPTVMVDVNHNMEVMSEETFGPVLPIVIVENDEEAIKRANDSKFGLSAAIWTKNLKHGEKIARELKAGSITINDSLYHFGISDVPIGGVKESGFGRTHAKEGLLEMVNTKYVGIDARTWEHKLYWYGYNQSLYDAMKAAVKFLYSKNIIERIKSLKNLLPHLIRRDRI
jgi:succinate-semialdehyde dehydrogenase/glutarate-semialdehyde dehydrogenase